MELGLEAYLTGERRVLLNRIFSDPGTRMEATLSLPFNKDLKKHFK